MTAFEAFKTLLNSIFQAIYYPFWFSLLFAFVFMFFYMFASGNDAAGKGKKAALKAWAAQFKTEAFFRKLFFFTFFTMVILFSALLSRTISINPTSNIWGNWGIWSESSDGTKTITAECFKNVIFMIPFIILLFWTFGERVLKNRSAKVIIWQSVKISFLFSLTIEILQLFLKLGTFQISDLFYNTLGGLIGGLIYLLACNCSEKEKHSEEKHPEEKRPEEKRPEEEKHSEEEKNSEEEHSGEK